MNDKSTYLYLFACGIWFMTLCQSNLVIIDYKNWWILWFASLKCSDLLFLASYIIRSRLKVWYVQYKYSYSSRVKQNYHHHHRKAIPGWKRFAIALDQGFRCAQCWFMLSTTFHVDHIIPLWKNGLDQECNWQVLCPSCHDTKTITKDRYH